MPRAALPPLKDRVRRIQGELARLYPDATVTLNFQTPLQLAVATILSAQCTDARVNQVTPALFRRFPDARAFAEANLDDIAELVKPTGFFRNKARHIQGFARAILAEHNGEVPADLEALVKLPGVGRKTANVVLGDAFGIPGITVDTHVGRVSRRLGFTRHTDPVKAEHDLMRLWPRPVWTLLSHRVILHGRSVCAARKPACARCSLLEVCPRRGLAPLPSSTQEPCS